MSGNQKTEKPIVLESGNVCTISGEWEVQGHITTLSYISKDDLMPLYCGKKVKWILLKPG